MPKSPVPIRPTAAASVLMLAAGVLSAQGLSAEDKLSAIRKGLVQAALDGPTQVTTTQWIDGNGALQELSAFRAGMRVRGVRVLAYNTDAQGESTAKLQWQEAEGVEGKSAVNGKAPALCKPLPKGHLQHVLGWNWTNLSALDADSAPVVGALQSTVLAQLQQAGAQDGRWRLVERPQQEGRTSYQQALLGSSKDELPWSLTMELLVLGSKVPGETHARVGRTESNALPNPPVQVAGLQVQLRTTLTARKQWQPTWQSTAKLALRTGEDNWAAATLSTAAREQVLEQVAAWSQSLQERLACLPVIADVTQAAGAQLRVNAGTAAGVRVGDEWVLAHDQNAVQGALNPAGAAQTVLAKVQAVGPYSAQLKPVAGNGQSVQTSWSAWSAEAAR
ncbi:MAG: hypothetical protein ACKOWD_03350 [Rhodoferax sp.]